MMEAEAPPDRVLDLGYVWNVLVKRRLIVAVAVGGAFLCAALYSWSATPIYTATTVLMLEDAPLDVVDLADVLTRAMRSEDPAYDNTQYEILKSRSLVAQVIESEGLEQEPLLAAPAGAGEKSPPLVDRYIEKWLSIVPSYDSRLVNVSFSSPDPELSARVANAHAQAYIGYGLSLRTQASLRAVEFLQGTLDDLQQRASRSVTALKEFRQQSGNPSIGEGESLVAIRLENLQDRLATVELERIELEAQIQLMDEKGYGVVQRVQESDLIRSLRDQLGELESELVLASATLRPAAPQRLDLKAQIDDARKRLRDEMRRVGEGVRAAYLASLREEERLRAELDVQRGAALDEKAASLEFAVLAHEAEVNQRLLQTVRDRVKEMSVLSDVQASGVFVIDEAHPPQKPSHPRTTLNLAVGLVGGVLVGLILVFLVETMDNRLRTAEEVERYLGLPVLGKVPDLALLARGGAQALIAPDAELKTPRVASSTPRRLLAAVAGRRASPIGTRSGDLLATAASEAYRSVRTSLLLSQAGEAPRSMLFTSTTTREGKTTTAINTALMYSQMSDSVLLIDADLRRRRCSTLLGLGREPGLGELLTGQQKSIPPYRYRNASVNILPAGASPPNPTELLGSETMRQLLPALRERYDYIVIDAPPLDPVSDALVLATLVDGVVLVVDGQGTARQLVREARNRLLKARAKLLGVVLNRVEDRGSYAYYGPDQTDDVKQRA